MLTKDNVTIGIEWRFGPDWPGQQCGAKTRRGTARQRPAPSVTQDARRNEINGAFSLTRPLNNKLPLSLIY